MFSCVFRIYTYVTLVNKRSHCLSFIMKQLRLKKKKIKFCSENDTKLAFNSIIISYFSFKCRICFTFDPLTHAFLNNFNLSL